MTISEASNIESELECLVEAMIDDFLDEAKGDPVCGELPISPIKAPPCQQ